MSTGDLNPGPLACMMNILSAEYSPCTSTLSFPHIHNGKKPVEASVAVHLECRGRWLSMIDLTNVFSFSPFHVHVLEHGPGMESRENAECL